ncbi:MAG: sugar-transfer associated ATP-grasp domain-containing protein [Ancrocorticia sp.]|uniref:sugar-transfer associated ATP-grasp domain-containing protein n=1 Tax=Ancrocorticia sp. TaxID=2593684 RepID=UPI003F93AC7A
MPVAVKKTVKFLKLTYLWVVRILFASNHFNVPFWRRLHLAIVGGFVPDQYVLYDLKHRPKSAYLSEFDWYRSRFINDPFNPMLNNKIVCAEVMKDDALVPETLFIKNKGRYVSYADRKRLSNVDGAMDALKEAGSVFMKPIGAGKGKGVHRLDFRDGQTYLDETATPPSDIKALLRKQDGWFFCRCIEQHPGLAKIYDKTSNTIRLITLRDPENGKFKVFFAVLRIGTAKTVPIDNGSVGGLVAKIDLDTGTLSEARSLWAQTVHPVHPNSAAPIEGVQIPQWEELKAQMVELAERFPFLQFVAWDILLAQEGPYIIEANTSSGVNIIQIWGPQRQNELGDFYRAHGVIH